METIANAGIPVGIAVAPVIPGYSESDIPKLLERAKNAGATRAFMSMLHLDSDSIEQYFVAKMHEKLSPTAVTKIINALKRERGGQLQHRTFKERGTGKTEQWEVTRKLFDFHAKRLGFRGDDTPVEVEEAPTSQPAQQSLF